MADVASDPTAGPADPPPTARDSQQDGEKDGGVTGGASGGRESGGGVARGGVARGGVDRGVDPDYRFTLANERTFLAWFRTALALIAGGVAVVQLIPEFAFPGARHALGILLTVMGGSLALLAVRRWQRVQAAMRRDEDLPPTRVPALLGWGLALLTAFVVVLIIISSARQ